MTAALVVVGRVLGAFGVRGEVRIASFTEDPLALACYRELRRADGAVALTVLDARMAKDVVIVRTAEVVDKEAADALRGLVLHVTRDVLPAIEDEDEVYVADLIGMEALTPQGERLGRVADVKNFGADDLLEIAPDQGPSWWAPFTKATVPAIDLASGRLTVVPPREPD